MRAVQPIRQTVWAASILAREHRVFNPCIIFIFFTHVLLQQHNEEHRQLRTSKNASALRVVPEPIHPHPLILQDHFLIHHPQHRNRIGDFDIHHSFVTL